MFAYVHNYSIKLRGVDSIRALLIVCIALLLVFPTIAFAEDSGPSDITLFLYNMCTGLGMWFLWVGGYLLDYTIGLLVVGMGDMLSGGFGTAIDELWTVVRDIFNLAFIFGLIFIGFKTIWNANDSDTRRALGMLIAAALLINFSLFAVKVVVDFSNVLAFQVYELIQVPRETSSLPIKGISGAFGQYMELQSFTKQQQNKSVLTDAAADSGASADMRLVGFGLMMMIFMMIAGFVFAAGAILLVVRFVVLVLFMIFSPFLLLGWVMPAFASQSRQRFHQLISYALMAPAFLFMIYLSLTTLSRLQSTGSFASALRAPSSDGTFQVIIYFFVITGFVIASLFVARQMGVVGANHAISTGNWLQKKGRSFAGRTALRASSSTTAYGLRNIIGRGAAAYADSETAKRWGRRGGLAGFAGRKAMSVADRTSQASFDARNVGGLGKQTGTGKGQKGGFRARQKAINEREKRMAKLVESDSDERYYEDAGVEDLHNTHKRSLQERDRLRAELSNTTDREKRERIADELKRRQNQIEELEKPEKLKASEPRADWTGDAAAWKAYVKRAQEYGKIRRDMKKTTQNEYAANLEQRGKNLPPVFKFVYRVVGRTVKENEQAAATIRKEVSKDKDDKLLAAIEKNSKGNKDEE